MKKIISLIFIYSLIFSSICLADIKTLNQSSIWNSTFNDQNNQFIITGNENNAKVSLVLTQNQPAYLQIIFPQAGYNFDDNTVVTLSINNYAIKLSKDLSNTNSQICVFQYIFKENELKTFVHELTSKKEADIELNDRITSIILNGTSLSISAVLKYIENNHITSFPEPFNTVISSPSSDIPIPNTPAIDPQPKTQQVSENINTSQDTDVIIFLIIISFLSITAAACAVKRKGLSSLWIFLTIFFSPLLLIIELLPNYNKQNPRIIPCPLCHKEISSEVKKCPSCGHSMPRGYNIITIIYEILICIIWIIIIALLTLGIVLEKNQIDYQSIFQNKGEENLQLGLSYDFGINGKTIDYNKAVEFYLKADKLGNPKAQYSLGTMFFSGKGVNQDDNKAMFYFQKSCDNGWQKGCEAIKQFNDFKKKYPSYGY